MERNGSCDQSSKKNTTGTHLLLHALLLLVELDLVDPPLQQEAALRGEHLDVALSNLWVDG